MKGKRLEANWETFQNEHPEIKVIRDPVTNKIQSVRFSKEVESYSIICNGQKIEFLDFVTVNGKHFCFPH